MDHVSWVPSDIEKDNLFTQAICNKREFST